MDASIDIQPYDVQLMLKSNTSEPDLELEGSHIGRGSHYYDSEVNVWNLMLWFQIASFYSSQCESYVNVG